MLPPSPPRQSVNRRRHRLESPTALEGGLNRNQGSMSGSKANERACCWDSPITSDDLLSSLMPTLSHQSFTRFRWPSARIISLLAHHFPPQIRCRTSSDSVSLLLTQLDGSITAASSPLPSPSSESEVAMSDETDEACVVRWRAAFRAVVSGIKCTLRERPAAIVDGSAGVGNKDRRQWVSRQIALVRAKRYHCWSMHGDHPSAILSILRAVE